MRIRKLFGFCTGLLLAPALFTGCEEAIENVSNTLAVTPNSVIEFAATGNTLVVLTVETDADSWKAETDANWLTLTQDENTLSVEAGDNTSTMRVARISFTAGNAEPVSISVTQAAAEGSDEPEDDASASIADASDQNEITAVVSTATPVYEAKIKLTLNEPAESEMTLKLALDTEYAPEYSITHDNIEVENLPADKVTVSNDGVLTVKAGETVSNEITVSMDLSEGVSMKNYLVSLTEDPAAPSGLAFADGKDRVTWIIQKRIQKEVKNIAYLEVNNTNPLNLLEYKLEDGSPFFDVAVIFAANIRYDAESDIVYLYNNPNVQALLDETDVYIQPLREAGIQVQLGLLCDHTPAGLNNLSVDGAKMFAADVASAVAKYKLDGCSLNNEHMEGTSDSYLFDPSAGGAYLCYELEKQMEEQCSWPVQISLFSVLWSWAEPEVNGVVYKYSDYVDAYFDNYNYVPAEIHEGFTKKNVANIRMECNLGYGWRQQERYYTQTKEEGYGWVMWFAFHPQVGGGLDNNADRVDPVIKEAARGLYDMDLQEPTGYYTKTGDGRYDPTRHERDW